MTLAGTLLGADRHRRRDRPARRFTMGIPELTTASGSCRSPSGIFGLAEAIGTLAAPADRRPIRPASSRLWPDARERRRAAASSLRGTAVGSLLGILPGGGPLLASFASYAVEKKFVSPRHALGSGAIEGVAGPESANNAAAQTSFVPLLTLGLPSNAVMALLLGALIVHGIQPGPGIIAKEPALFWGLVASMWIGNAMLLVLNLPLVGVWARLLRVPYRLLYPTTVVLSCTGVYAINHSTIDVAMTAFFGAAGYLLRTRGFEPAPLLLGFVLSRPLEENFRRALVFADGDVSTFVTHPISAVLLVIACGSLLLTAVPAIRRRRARFTSTTAVQ